jgi:hypothetical protein
VVPAGRSLAAGLQVLEQRDVLGAVDVGLDDVDDDPPLGRLLGVGDDVVERVEAGDALEQRRERRVARPLTCRPTPVTKKSTKRMPTWPFSDRLPIVAMTPLPPYSG